MISLDCHHPDLEDFLDIKTDLNRVTKANISVRITDDFMEAVINDKDFDLIFHREETGEDIVKTIKAKEMFMKLAKNNWDFAEPGCLFWDRISKWNLLSEDPDFFYAGTNPCAEEPLPAGGSCLLGSLNLAAFVKDPFTKNARFDMGSFIEATKIAVIGLNEVLDEGLALHPLQEQRDSVRDWRQIGLGIFGLADMLIKLRITYGSEESIKLCDKIGYNLAQTAILTSADLGYNFGSYPKYDVNKVKDSAYLQHQFKEDITEYLSKHGLRNSQLLTIAPTGSISTMLGVSGGIEPIFANSYTRKTESLHGADVYYKVYTPIVEEYMRLYGLKEEEELPDFFITSGTLDYKQRIMMQAIWQDHIDASISSTVNVPNEFSIEDTFNLYVEAWKAGLKGVTIFRDGCARLGVLSTSEPSKTSEQQTADGPTRGQVIPTADNLVGLKRKLMTGCGSLHCTAFFSPETGDLQEVYLSKGSTGGCNNFMIGLSRMISMSVRAGVKLDDVIDQLMSTGSCPSYASRSATKHDTSKGSCCPMAVGYALKDMHKHFHNLKKDLLLPGQEDPNVEEEKAEIKCPNCGEKLYFEGGCNICKSCGWTKCD